MRHNHIIVNGTRVNIPSYLTRTGDVVQVDERSRKNESIHESLRRSRETLAWLAIDKVNLTGTVSELPGREDIPTEDRMRILRLIENMTLGRNAVGYLTESMHGAGSPQAQRIQILRGMEVETKKWHARKLTGIKQEA